MSVIVPLFNERENVAPLMRALDAELVLLGKTVEVLLVDDGSVDATFEVARDLVKIYPYLKVIRFRRNYGQTAAMVAGIDYAAGEILVTMDGDLQNDPRDIAKFLAEIEKGFDLVVGWRHNRRDKWITRILPSLIANKLIAKVTGVPIRDNGCSLKAYRASVIKSIPLYSEMHRYIPAMSSMAGIRISELKVRHHARRFGNSKYGLSRIYKVALDLLAIHNILSMIDGPLKYFARFAAILMIPAGVVAWAGIVNSSLVFLSIATLVTTCSLGFLFWGMLCELLIMTGDTKRHDLAQLTLAHDARQNQID